MPTPRPSVLVAAGAVLTLLASLGCGLDELALADVGTAPRCDEVDRWPAVSAEAEAALYDAIDALRRSGAECGGETLVGVGPLEPVPALHCAARLHAGDLIRHPSLPVDHEGSDGSSALGRANAAGYEGIARQELLAGDFTSAEALVAAWLLDPVHCRAVLDDDLDHVGVAQAQSRTGDRVVWVVVTGQERR
jgi:uncharacterized protein YkwD